MASPTANLSYRNTLPADRWMAESKTSIDGCDEKLRAGNLKNPTHWRKGEPHLPEADHDFGESKCEKFPGCIMILVMGPWNPVNSPVRGW